MAETQAPAGWYPDPSGDASRIRYWDGAQWTDDYAAAQAQPADAQAAGAKAEPQYVQAEPIQPPTGYTPDFRTASYQQQGQYIYPMTDQDRTLRLVAFVFNVVSCVASLALIFPLVWMIPMTVYSWGIYKGTRANTTAFAVCDLIFLNLIGGILLLISAKDDKIEGRVDL